MATEVVSTPIFDYTTRCKRGFVGLILGFKISHRGSESSESTGEVPNDDDIARTFKRFELWCSSTGAHLKGPQSLDERLRDASKIRDLVLDCLIIIQAALEEKQSNLRKNSAGQADTSEEEDPELEDILSAIEVRDPIIQINSNIDTILRVSVAIRPALSTDRYERAQKTELVDEQFFRKKDAQELVEMGCDALVPEVKKRILDANIQRRRILQYTHNYYERYKYATRAEIDTVETRGSSLDKMNSDADSIISRTGSTFSTLDIFNSQDLLPDDRSDTSSVISSSKPLKYHTPPFPAVPDDEAQDLRTCIACYLLLPIKDRETWKRHILRDIRPYVCTFAGCLADPGKLYSSQQAWFEHELNYHRLPPKAQVITQKSLNDKGVSLDASAPNNGESRFTSPPYVKSKAAAAAYEPHCPFCGETRSSLKSIRSHIARHQKQVALMALCSMRDVDPADSDEEEVGDDIINDTEQLDTGTELGEDDRRHELLEFPTVPQFGDPDDSGSEGAQDPSVKFTVSPDPEPSKDLPSTKSSESEGDPQGHPQKESPLLPPMPQETLGSKYPSFSDVEPASTDVDDLSKVSTRSMRFNTKTNRDARPQAWIFMQDLSSPYAYKKKGSFSLGQVLLQPRQATTILKSSEILKPERYSMHETRTKEWQMHSIRENSATFPGISAKAEFSVEAYEVLNMSFIPDQEYVQRLTNIPSVRTSLLGIGAKRAYVVTGLLVGWNVRVARYNVTTRGINISAPVEVTGIDISAGVHLNRAKENAWSAEGPIILAYSLSKIKKSMFGNLLVNVFEKGDFR